MQHPVEDLLVSADGGVLALAQAAPLRGLHHPATAATKAETVAVAERVVVVVVVMAVVMRVLRRLGGGLGASGLQLRQERVCVAGPNSHGEASTFAVRQG